MIQIIKLNSYKNKLFLSNLHYIYTQQSGYFTKGQSRRDTENDQLLVSDVSVIDEGGVGRTQTKNIRMHSLFII